MVLAQRHPLEQRDGRRQRLLAEHRRRRSDGALRAARSASVGAAAG
ncbi:hypothetical protein [Actinomadura sp. NEAU-AAG7]|nr:hypothetical protein [Actinomadura sp. NEAU-AAG7]MBT2206571.1 hypothetical protein [Actinomadura sp. NEAU-AAG7]